MQIKSLTITNFKSIRQMHIPDIENALILVGQNNTGKTTVLDAIRAVGGAYAIRPEDFNEDGSNIEIAVSIEYTIGDLRQMQDMGLVSSYHRFDAWQEDFSKKLPSYQDGVLQFTFTANRKGKIRYRDGYEKHNGYIPEIFPKIYNLDTERNLRQLEENLLLMQEDGLIKQMRSDCCLFEASKKCHHCFSCIGLIGKKTPKELNAFEAAKLLDYKLYQLSLDSFAKKVNENFRKNGGVEEIRYSMNRDMERMLQVTTEIYHPLQQVTRPLSRLGKGMRSIYMLSLLEAYAKLEDSVPCLIIEEEPESSLHPTQQKTSGEILYRLSKKNQVIFSTHSPNLLANFTTRQIRQVTLDEKGYPMVREKTDISVILDDLGYTASDLMHVNFVFIVEGKQDKSRLPLLLKKYYAEISDGEGNLSRIAILTTNSCTNIRTYANLKYMNQIYLKNQFMMIRDGDGKNPKKLRQQLCRYYKERSLEDVDGLPRVSKKNVLILKYYSFENYFLDPKIMAQLGVVESEEAFYRIFLEKWETYLHRLRSGQHLLEVIGEDLKTPEDVKSHMEEIKRYLRGHNLFDIYYGRYRGQETELLQAYIDLAPRSEFADILDAIDSFIYFESRKK
ncbi:MAG: ATP-binding protein [Lachnospiraceae bacterium]|jgi:putative ATP-dependent endonuclease of OLD family|nr:ATP-binding protein [Lachnospiraceae bacterium]